MKKFLAMYQRLSLDNLHILAEVYSKDVQFIDPAHKITGLTNLTQYFAALYKNVESIEFSFDHMLENDSEGYVQWLMTFSHKKLAGGKPISVNGTTFLQFDSEGKVYYHRDYFDLGAMLYEQLPLLGRLVKLIKKGLGK
jgi:hypothetical protein